MSSARALIQSVVVDVRIESHQRDSNVTKCRNVFLFET